MGTIPYDIRRLLDDCEMFVSEILEGENLSEDVEETRQVLLNNFRVVHTRNPQEFPLRLDEEGSDDNRSSSLGRSAHSDDASDYQEDATPDYFGDVPAEALQDVTKVVKQGFLEKKRKDHSFFGSEWQKRFCLLTTSGLVLYYGSEKDRQQKGSFLLSDYSVQMVSNLRKDSRRNCCFEFSAPGRRAFQFAASSSAEAQDWLDHFNLVLAGLSSNTIPFDEEEEEEGVKEEEEEEPYDDIEGVLGSTFQGGGQEEEEEEEDIYEVLPGDDIAGQSDESSENKSVWACDYANYYQGLWDCRADQDDELDFQRGDLIYIISKEYNIHGWWVGERDGCVGIVPKDFLHAAFIL